MGLPRNRTKIVCTMGPASEAPVVVEAMLRAGMNVARLNFSHGTFDEHAARIRLLRTASENTGLPLAILADLPGPKIRLGELASEPIQVESDAELVLTTEDVVGDAARMTVHFEPLPRVVTAGDTIFLNDGFLELKVLEVRGRDVRCRVRVGGELRSRKGVNLPGIDLGIPAFTDHDRACLEFAVAHGVDAVSQSFVETAEDIRAVKEAAHALGADPFVIAKIERSRALENLDGILEAADGLMAARGDLGVEIPVARIAPVQKDLIRAANRAAKPIITATHMLESMTTNRRPTRAEATDVANAILDGTDAVMLSGESAVGKYPVDAVRMLVSIAAAIEPRVEAQAAARLRRESEHDPEPTLRDLIAASIANVVQRRVPAAVFVPTRSGAVARHIARFRLPLWITAVTRERSTARALQLTYGVHAVEIAEHPEDWRDFAKSWLDANDVEGHLVYVTEGPSRRHPEANDRLELLDLRR